MLIVLSPAKSLDFKTPSHSKLATMPEYLEQSQFLVNVLKNYSPAQLASLMKLSDKLSSLNVARFGSWTLPFTVENAKQAILCFTGDVYKGLDAASLDPSGLDYAQDKIRILSGLYGLLRPMDLIQPYRLEMGSKVSLKNCRNLYDFWGTQLQQNVSLSLDKDPFPSLINLASKEYFTSLKLPTFPHQVITPIFKNWKNGQYKNISFFAKKARGLMSRYSIDHQIKDPQQLKDFHYEGYQFSAKLSSKNDWVFTRKQ